MMKLTRKSVFTVLLLSSLLFNGYHLLRAFPIRIGGGSYKPSPSKAFVAYAQSYANKNRLAEDYNVVGGDLEIRAFQDRMGDDLLIALTVKPPGINNEMGYRMLENPIAWSSDSATATFDLPHVVAQSPQSR